MQVENEKAMNKEREKIREILEQEFEFKTVQMDAKYRAMEEELKARSQEEQERNDQAIKEELI